MKSPVTQRQKLEAKEAAILSAAHAEFAMSGFEGTRMAAIAQRAAVAEGTVYLYYRNKAELLQAVVARFWNQLTVGAREVTDAPASTLDKFEALARYHLQQVLADFDFVELTSQVRRQQGQTETALAPIRTYVRVFDEVFQRGVDRGEFHLEAVRRHWRDLFYGQLEYSARTLALRQQTDSASIDSVVAHLIAVVRRGLLRSSGELDVTASTGAIGPQLHRIEAKLDRLLAAPGARLGGQA